MSSLQGAQTSGPGDHPSHVIQIYPRLKQVTAQCLTLQVTAAQTTAAVIQHAVATLGIDTQRSYSLLELKESDGEETVLEDGEHPVNRYFLWPPETHRWHPKSKGYYFILQPLLQEGEAWLEELVEDYDDLCRLPELSEDALLQTLRKRFYKKKIYTYASSILVAVNPFKFLPCYYNPKYVMMYENQPLGKLSPHIFAVANVAYHAMLNRRLDQCIVISGESGSGKTESSSYLVHCLTALSQKRYASGVVRTLLGAGPVLEAFGNATTAQNNNSSRFGKFVQLNYLESGVIRGAIIEKYLLEKSRLVCRDTSERNYHVFYYLLIGASKEERKEFSLLQPQEYNYLQQEDLSIEGEEKLRHEYKRLHQAMEMVGFLASTKKLIFSILSAILYLGNVTYTVSEEGEVIKVGPDDVLSTLSDLLKVKQELLVNALTQRRAVVSNDTLVLPYMLKEATTARDSMAKSLYSALFDWIVLHINHTLLNRRDMEESVSCLSIGILDIFGFENFQTNSFEQFCINYTNEKLHHYFSQYVFNRQQEEYLSEGISWSTIAYGDNEGVINMFSKKPTGFFHLLDEESNLPQATDGTLLDKLKQHHKDNPLFVGTAVMEPAFVIQHFAGRVKYQIKDFRVKNTDHMRPDVVLLLRGSERAFLRQLVCSSPAALFRWGVLRATIRITAAFRALARRGAQTDSPRRTQKKSLREIRKNSQMYKRLSSPNMTLDFSFDHSDEQPLEVFEDIFDNYEQRKRNRSGRQKQIIPKKLMDSHSLKHIVALTVNGRTSQLVLHPHQRKKPPSISAQFQASLCNLLDSVGKAEPFFIRCIRSNAEKREMYFDEALVLHQIKYSGMLEMVRIQKAGFGAKYTFEEFVKKFWVLMPKGAAATSEDITKLFQNMGVDQSTYQMGKTKVFLKESQRQRLQETLNKEVMRSVVILQRWFRCCLIRMHFLNKKDAALLIQRCWREFYETNQGRAAIIIQTAWRTSLQKSESQDEGSREEISKSGPGRQSLERRALRRQDVVDTSPCRSPERLGDGDGTGGTGREEGRASPPALTRPFSVPLDPRQGPYTLDPSPSSISLQRYTNMDSIQVKGKEWKERRSEGDKTDESSPERLTPKAKVAYQTRGKSMSVDELSKLKHSSGSDSSPSSQESSAEPDGSRYSLPPKSTHESSLRLSRSNPTTPERPWFLSKILRKKAPLMIEAHKEESPAALAASSKQPQHRPGQDSFRVSNPSILISRATRGKQLKAALDRDVANSKELRHLDEFLGSQVMELNARIKDLSATESIFLSATSEFRVIIKCMYAYPKPQVSYIDLLKGYHNKVNRLASPHRLSEVTLVVNLFQSMLDGFIRGLVKQEEAEPVKKTKKRRKKEKCMENPLDHMFSTYQVNIMQSCDLCGSYIWGMEKAYMCSACKLICHKKCLAKIITDCLTRCARKDSSTSGSLHFGVDVSVLSSPAQPVPQVLEMLLVYVEMNGLDTEGIYRKSGSACRARELHQILETNPETASLENYPIHTITGLVKRWLRELPEPLMTFNLYNDFLHAAELPEKSERIRAIYQKVDELPESNYSTLERLIFHLVKVAKEEVHNRMTASSLAIVFAPCIMRSPDADDPFLGMKDVNKTTQCVEVLIMEQFRRYTEKMQNIKELEYAETLAIHQLQLKRQNTIAEKDAEKDAMQQINFDNDYEKSLIERIKSIKEEKEDLACTLPDLEQETSDDNLDNQWSVSSDSLGSDRLGSLDSEGKCSGAQSTTSQKPDCPPKPPDLAERVKQRMGRTDEPPPLPLTEPPPLDPPADRAGPSQPTPTDAPSLPVVPALPKGPQLKGKKINGNLDGLNIPFIDEDTDNADKEHSEQCPGI
ncbi:unconventional myosin-IXb isoform X2 [Gadus morhua]|uniref:unconventional myosin-IXb isoform X2 n=1 Tax=Gadus morhua TaxID=8049 RepID=UPI0011B4E807|nr:unconventional myosin-IXb-like isoform X2 [Gadus morhua]